MKISSNLFQLTNHLLFRSTCYISGEQQRQTVRATWKFQNFVKKSAAFFVRSYGAENMSRFI